MILGKRKRMCWTAGTALAAIAFSTQAQAQAQQADRPAAEADEGTQDDEEIVVVGVRDALAEAARTKRDADTVVDSISATDIGAFPDKSVAEALQRVPGVTVIRSAAKDDVMHYSAEPSGVVIRGLQQVRSEFNGRDSFSATSGYGLSWSDVSPELMSRVDTYKNQTAEMIEGGIAGTVDLRTRVPFDQDGELLTVSATQNFGSISQRATPDISGLYSNTWETGIGRLGVLGNVAYSNIITRSQGTTTPRLMPFAPGTYEDRMVYIPSGIGLSETDYDRERLGVSIAGQWESKDGGLVATAQYNRSQYETTWIEHQLLSYWTWVDPANTNHSTVWTDPTLILSPRGPGPNAPNGPAYTFNEDGLFQTGVITASRGGWGFGGFNWDTGQYIPGSTDQYGVLPNGLPLYQPCLNIDITTGGRPCRAGSPLDIATRYSNEDRVISDAAFNLVWQATDRLQFNFDYQRVKATNYNYDITFNMRAWADIDLDLRGETPKVTLLQPSGYNTTGTDWLTNPSNYTPASAMDHITDSTGRMDAFRVDGAYSFDTPWLSEIRFGGRYADREQSHQWSVYNWQSITSDWQTNPAGSVFANSGRNTVGRDANGNPILFEGYGDPYWEVRPYAQDIFGGGVFSNRDLLWMRSDILADPRETYKRFSIGGQTDEGGIASSQWNPICYRPEEIEGSCFTPGELLDVQEKTKSAYVMAKFGGDNASLGSISVNGNIGLRYVNLNTSSVGSMIYADAFTAAETNCVPLTPEQIAQLGPGQYAISPGCLAAGSTQDQAFSTGGSVASTVENKTEYWLPSLNMRFGLDRDLFVRFAASRAISKPDIGLLKNFMQIRRGGLPQSEIRVGNPNIVLGPGGNPVSYNYAYTAQMGNPRLRPIEADQFDISIEKYDGDVGSFSLAGFYKKFRNYIQNGTFSVPVTNGGVTRDVIVTGPVNGDGASIYGFEAAFQRYFDFLPGVLSGLGFQGNYTYIKNKGMKNAQLVVDTTGGSAVARSALPGMIQVDRLENLSDHSFNAILLYEKGPIGARLAYNWRSEYVNSINDCCLGFPVWNEAEGFLDASLRYAVTSRLEFNFQASNLLNTRIKMKSQVSGPTDAEPNRDVKFLPGGQFEYDQRFQFGVRAKF